MNLVRRYIIDENNQKIAVQLDIETFEKIENIMENHALYQLMLNDRDEEELRLEDALKHYKNLCENQCNLNSRKIPETVERVSKSSALRNRRICLC